MPIVYVVIGLAIGFVAYRSSEAFKRKHNVTPGISRRSYGL